MKQIAKEIEKHIDEYKIIITKSTVPVGTTQKVKKIIEKEIAKRGKNISFDVASNSEFLKEGSAVSDCLYPDRVIIGAEKESVKDTLIDLHKDFTDTIITMDISSAELTKYAANAMLACRISFMNQIANICKNVGANVNDVKRGMQEDKRIGKLFLEAGIGYGGSCFPKDVKSLSHIAKKAKVEPTLIDAIDRVNIYQKVLLAKYIKDYFLKYQNLKGKTLSIWGLSFKPNTDDMREASSLVMIDYLLKKGATLKLYDPIAMSNAKKLIKNSENIQWCNSAIEATKNSDRIVLVTEWDEFKKIDLLEVKKLMNSKNIFDGRDFFDPKKIKRMGFNYVGIGIADEFIKKPIIFKTDKQKETHSFFQRNWLFLNIFAIIAIVLAILTKIYHLNLIKKLKNRSISSSIES